MNTAVIHGEGLGKRNGVGAEPVLPLNLSGRIRELDGLRGVAIGMVLIYHYFYLTWVTRPGSLPAYIQACARLSWSGVDLFFVLSGFLIGGILLDARASTNYFKVFYTRRFFRIVPIYAALLLILPVLLTALQRLDTKSFVWLTAEPLPWYTYWTFTQNFWMVRAVSLGANSLGMTWSLAIEEQFYLTLPLLVRALSGRWLTRCVLAGVCTAPVLRIILLVIWPQNWTSRFVLMPCRADALLLGVLAAILLRDARWRAWIQRNGFGLALLISALLFGLGFLTLRSAHVAARLMQSVGYTWLALFYVSVLVFALTKPESILSRVLRAKWMGWLGAIAYGTYLLHQPILGMLFGSIWGHDPLIIGGHTLLTVVMALVVTFVIARLSWRYFEQPLIRTGHRSKYESPEPEASEMSPSAPRLVCL